MCDLFVSLLVGMTVFSQLGHIAFLLNKDITNAVKSRKYMFLWRLRRYGFKSIDPQL